MRYCILFCLLFFCAKVTNAQYDNIRFSSTEESQKKGYVNFEQLDELTERLVNSNKNYFDDATIQGYINYDLSKLPNYSDEELHQRILKIPSSIPMKFTPEIGQIIRYFVFKRREYVTRMLTNAQSLFPIFEEKLDERNLPMELKCLAIVESALNPLARSRVGATGLWQFMHGTAINEGMEINSLYDQRSDVFASTDYAINFLEKLHNIYGDWLLALAAYNSGPGNVNKAIKNSGGFDFWTIKHRLPRETQNYIPSFIAAVYVMYYHKDYMLYPAKPKINFKNTVQHVVREKQSLKYVSELLGSNEDYLKQFNPCLKKNIIPAGYKIVLPKELQETFIAKTAQLPNDPYVYSPEFVYNKQTNSEESNANANAISNETNSVASESEEIKTPTLPNSVTEIAKLAGDFKTDEKEQTNINNEEIVAVENNFANPVLNDSIQTESNQINDEATIKVEKQEPIVTNETNQSIIEFKVVKKEELTKTRVNHVVKKGETLFDIAKEYKMSVSDLKQLNNIDNNEDGLIMGESILVYKYVTLTVPQYVPVTSNSQTSSNANSSKPAGLSIAQASPDDIASKKTIVHIIKKGETLIQLTRLYGCSLQDIYAWNKLKNTTVKPGDEIIINKIESEPTNSEIVNFFYYTAKNGDTLQTASSQYNIPIELLKNLNNISENTPLRNGEKIKIPNL